MPLPSEFRIALRDAAPVVLALVPFGLVFGALCAEAGLTAAQAAGFSGILYAGAAQLVALQLMILGTPLWVILLSVLMLNLRLVLYSAALGRKMGLFDPLQKAAAFFILTDPAYVSAELRAGQARLTPFYYFSYGLSLYVVWMITTLAGLAFGRLIDDPARFGLDLMVPIYFIIQTMAFRARPGFIAILAASAVTSIAVYVTLGSPWHVMLGGLAGILVAVLRTPARGEGAPSPAGNAS